MTTKDKYIQLQSELIQDSSRIITLLAESLRLVEQGIHQCSAEYDDIAKEITSIKPRYLQIQSELSSLKAEMEKEDTDELKDELLKFKKWYDSLSPASKCTVHPPAGSGGSYGIHNLTDAGLVNIYLSKTPK